MKVEINLQDRVDELIDLVLVAENQVVGGEKKDEIIFTLQEIYSILEIYEF